MFDNVIESGWMAPKTVDPCKQGTGLHKGNSGLCLPDVGFKIENKSIICITILKIHKKQW